MYFTKTVYARLAHRQLRDVPLRRLPALAFAALLLAGCGFGAEPTPTPTPLTLRYVTFTGLDAAEQALIENFHTTNPHIAIQVEEYNQPPEAYLSTTPAPDLMLITPGQFLASAAAGGQLTDLSGLWPQAGADPQLLEHLSSLSAQEGKQYYLPAGYNWTGTYYNKAIFQQYGLTPPQTWDELIQLSENLWLNGVAPFAISGADPFMGTLWFDYLDLRLNGPAFHQEFLAGDVPYNDPRVRTVFELWASLVEKGYFLQTAATQGIDDALTTVAPPAGGSPQAAMVLSGPAFLGALPQAQRDQLGFFPFPSLDPSQPSGEVVMAIGHMIPAQAPHRDAALAFADLLASPAGQELLTKDVVATGLYAPIFTPDDGTVLPEVVRQGMALVQGASAISAPYYMSVSAQMWPALAKMQRRLLTEPGSAREFDLDGMLAELEAAR